MHYQESIAYLKQCALLGSKPGLAAVSGLLERLGNPQNALQVIHIAGTNGKGSVGSLLHYILTEAGYRTGFFSSPFLECHREMIQLDRTQIAEEAFAAVLTEVRAAADSMVREGCGQPTEFELMTAAACLYFHHSGCDYAVIEAGMGGRLDATNVLQRPALSVLTRIDYDHEGFLGGGLTDIAGEKCGIFRSGCPVVVYPQQEAEVLAVICSRAERLGCPLILPDTIGLVTEQSSAAGTVFSYGDYQGLSLSLCGTHQVYNAVTALAAVSALQQQGCAVSERAVREGMQACRWPGRFELAAEHPPVILDGAHNLNGVRAFVKAVEDCCPDVNFVGVIAMLADKNYQEALAVFGRVCSRLIVTEVPISRTATADALRQAAENLGLPVLAVKEPEAAVQKALAMKEPQQGLLCAGSLYALPAFRRGLEKK